MFYMYITFLVYGTLLILVLVVCWTSTATSDDAFPSQSLITIYTLRILSGDLTNQASSHSREFLRNLMSASVYNPMNPNGQNPNAEHACVQINSNERIASEQSNEQLLVTDPDSPNDDGHSSTGNINDPVINICFRMLDDNQRVVIARLTQTIGELKQQYFNHELNTNKIVRFIFRGRLLRDEDTLQSCNITEDNTIVHCFISSAPPPSPGIEELGESGDSMNRSTISLIGRIDMSSWLMPLITVAIFGSWYMRVKFRRLFTPTSTIFLIFLTVLYASAIAAAICPNDSVRRSSNVVAID